MDKGAGKRKGGGGDGRMIKKRKVGTGGKWQTPHQKERLAERSSSRKIEPGDVGIWVTCQKGKEGKATGEVRGLFTEYAEKLYGITSEGPEAGASDDEADEEDIEAQIQKELASATQKKGANAEDRIFNAVRIDIACVLFFKTKAPVEPVTFSLQICKDLAANPASRRHRFLNRLTPVSLIGKANEKGLEEVARATLKDHFNFAGTANAEEELAEKPGPEVASCSYAIRPTIRAHKDLSRDFVIKNIADMVDGQKHKVDLTNPDKVIVVEIFQTVLGISVVPGAEYERLKRFNLCEIFNAATAEKNKDNATDEKPKEDKKEVTEA